MKFSINTDIFSNNNLNEDYSNSIDYFLKIQEFSLCFSQEKNNIVNNEMIKNISFLIVNELEIFNQNSLKNYLIFQKLQVYFVNNFTEIFKVLEIKEKNEIYPFVEINLISLNDEYNCNQNSIKHEINDKKLIPQDFKLIQIKSELFENLMKEKTKDKKNHFSNIKNDKEISIKFNTEKVKFFANAKILMNFFDLLYFIKNKYKKLKKKYLDIYSSKIHFNVFIKKIDIYIYFLRKNIKFVGSNEIKLEKKRSIFVTLKFLIFKGILSKNYDKIFLSKINKLYGIINIFF